MNEKPADTIKEIKSHKGKLWERPLQPGDPVGHKRYRYFSTIRAMHIPSSVRAWKRGEHIDWLDADIKWKETGTDFREGNALYRIRVPKDGIGYRYESRTEGFPFVEFVLTHLDGVPLTSIPTPQIIGNQLWWVDVVPGLDFYVVLTPDKADLRKRIRTTGAARSFRWAVKESNPLPLRRQQFSKGRDNHGHNEPSRVGLGLNRTRRLIEIETVITPIASPPPGVSKYTLEETWTGKTWVLDENRVKSLSTDFVLPIDIDTLVSEEISTDADDGVEYQDSWRDSYGGTGNGYVADQGYWDAFPGWRFTTVAVPKDATIDDATFKVEVATGGEGTLTGILDGAAEDDVAGWTTSNSPTDKTPIGAGTALTWTITPGNDIVVDVKTTIGQITSRSGWSTGNDLALFDQGPFDQPTNNYAYLEDESDADPGAGRLIINYTVGGGGLSIPILMHNYRQLRIA